MFRYIKEATKKKPAYYYIKQFSLIACITIAFTFINSADLFAVSPMKELSDIKEKITSKLREVKESKKKENSLSVKISGINNSIAAKEKELRSYDKRILAAQVKAKKMSRDIDKLRSALDKDMNYLKAYVVALYKRQYGGSALILSSAKDYQDLIRKSRYINLLAHYESMVIDKYRSEIAAINEKKKNFESLKNQLNESKKMVRLKKKELQVNRVEKDKLLAAVRGKRLAHERKIEELKESSKKLQGMVNDLKSGNIPKTIIGKGFRLMKGKLPWPVNGKVLTKYGVNTVSEFKTRFFKEGIEIGASSERKAKAVAGGRVVFADWFKDYGMLLIIDHGSGYHSLYGNLDTFSIKAGELIVEGMDVGSMKQSDRFNSRTLYFEIRHKGRALDPAKWLKNGQEKYQKIAKTRG